jgi:hypothetical protein
MTLHGIIPPMTTPFGPDGELALDLVKGQVDWLVGQGAHGLAAGGSTGEGHTLDAAEFRDLVAATVEPECARAPVIAGIRAARARRQAPQGLSSLGSRNATKNPSPLRGRVGWGCSLLAVSGVSASARPRS